MTYRKYDFKEMLIKSKTIAKFDAFENGVNTVHVCYYNFCGH